MASIGQRFPAGIGGSGGGGTGPPGVGVPVGGTTGQVLTKNSATNYDTGWSTPSSGGGGSTSYAVSQAAHGFTTGQAVYYNGTTWLLAKADNASTLGVGVVQVVDANNFNVVTAGPLTGLTGLTAGQYYFVSDVTAGTLSLVEPTSSSSFSNPVLFAVSATVGIVLIERPTAIFAMSNIGGLQMPDLSPSAPSVYNDEFNAGITLDPKWTLSAPVGAVVNVNTDCPGYARLKYPSAPSLGGAILLQAIPAGDFTIATKVRSMAALSGFNPNVGLYLSDTNVANTGHQIFVGLGYNAGYICFAGSFTAYGTYAAGLGTTPTWGIGGEMREFWIYLRLRRTGTTYFWSFSYNGTDWSPEQNGTWGFTPAYMGVGVNTNGSYSHDVEIDFFRYYPGNVSSIGNTVGGTISSLKYGYYPGVPSSALANEIMADLPKGFWKLDEASGNFADSSGNGNTLTVPASPPTYRAAKLIPTLSSAFAQQRNSGFYIAKSAAGLFGLALPYTGDYTFECVTSLSPIMTMNISAGALVLNELKLFTVVGANDETEANNFQSMFSVSCANGGMFRAFHEYGAGLNPLGDSDTPFRVSAFSVPSLFHVALVNIASSKSRLLYINGLLLDTVNYLTAPTGGTASSFYLGGDSSASANNMYQHGVMGYAAFYSTALSAARILVHAQAAGLA